MAKKSDQEDQEDQEQRRVSRKDVLRARNEAEQGKSIRIGVAIVAGLIGIVLLVAIVNELLVAPNRSVTAVYGDEISLSDWQDRVEYERAQRIIFLENQYDAFGGDVGIIQQFASQPIIELQDPAALGEGVLEQMTYEIAACQELENRGVSVSDSDVQDEIETSFSYFGGESPPAPDVEPTVAPTPVANDDAEAEPTIAPQPTPTPVSETAFNEELDGLLEQFEALGVSEETYRRVVRTDLCQSLLLDMLAEERELAAEAEQASISLLLFDSREAADDTMTMVDEIGFMTTWNLINSTPPTTETLSTRASEVSWRTQEDYASIFNEEIATQIFDLDLETSSGIVAVDGADGVTRYYIMMVSGREERPLTDAAIDDAKQQLMVDYLTRIVEDGRETSEFWRNRIPTQPILDSKFLAQPTPASLDPEAPVDPNTVDDTQN